MHVHNLTRSRDNYRPTQTCQSKLIQLSHSENAKTRNWTLLNSMHVHTYTWIILNFTTYAYVKHHAPHSDCVQKLPTNARRLVKCPTNSSTVTYYNSNCQSNPINSTLDVATALGKFQQISESQNKLPTLQNFLLVSKHSGKHIHETLSNIKIGISLQSTIH